jgi:hypothetical protein
MAMISAPHRESHAPHRSRLAQLSQLTASQVDAVVTGSGLIQVTPTTSLDAAVPGTGAIVYSGNPPR